MVRIGRLRVRRQQVCKVMAGSLATLAVVVAVRTDHISTDTDGDGIADCREQVGMKLSGAPKPIKTDPNRADTDGDGAPDGNEVILPGPSTSFTDHVQDLWSCRVLTLAALSDPTLSDSDDDGLNDAVELSEGFDPRQADGDKDGLTDEAERAWGSDPGLADTDGDGVPDGKETGDGVSPVVVDEAVDNEHWTSEYAKGIGLGEFDDIDSVPQLLGALSGGFSSSIPVVGWVVGTITDLRDTVAGLVKGDWSAALTSLAGVLPFAGDTATATKQIAKFAEKHPDQIRRLVEGIFALEYLPTSVRMPLLRAADATGVDGLRELDLSDETIQEFARRGTVLATLVEAAAKTSAVIQMVPGGHTDDDGFVETLADAQAALRTYAAKTDAPRVVADGPVYLPLSPAYVGGRLFDACTACAPGAPSRTSTLRIAKMASLTASPALQSQITKDAHLIQEGYSLEWHFFAGPTGWSVDPEVLASLEAERVPYVMHLPG